MQHAYSEDGLSPDWLKGTDRAQAEALFTAACGAGLEAHLALVTYRVVGEPEYPIDDEDDPESMEMGEIIDEELYATSWTDASGASVPLGELRIAPSDFLDGYDLLTEEVARTEFEGYTGNAGMELTRWYHCAAVILWHPMRTGPLLAATGVMQALAVLEHRLSHPAPNGATAACIASAALERWIRDGRPGHGERPEPGRMASMLAEIGNEALANQYLGQVLVADLEISQRPGSPCLIDSALPPWRQRSLGFGPPAQRAVWNGMRPSCAGSPPAVKRHAGFRPSSAPRSSCSWRWPARPRPFEASPSSSTWPRPSTHCVPIPCGINALFGLTLERADPAGVQAGVILAIPPISGQRGSILGRPGPGPSGSADRRRAAVARRQRPPRS